MSIFICLTSIAEIEIRRVLHISRSLIRFLISHSSIVELTLCGVGAHCQTASALFDKSYTICGGKAPQVDAYFQTVNAFPSNYY